MLATTHFGRRFQRRWSSKLLILSRFLRCVNLVGLDRAAQYSRDACDGIEKRRRTGDRAWAGMTGLCEATGHAQCVSQLPSITKRERGDAAGVLVEDQGAGDRRLGALAAILALTEPAVDADRRAFGFFQIYSAGVDQARRMANFA